MIKEKYSYFVFNSIKIAKITLKCSFEIKVFSERPKC